MQFVIENQGHWFWSRVWSSLRFLLVLAVWLPLPLGLAAVDRYGALVPQFEPPDDIAISLGQVPSRVRTVRGFQVGGLERGGADWVPFDEISDAFVRALLASEDARFFYHEGVDPEGIARAFRANLAADANVQGGSTITQQLAKSFVGDARTFERKLAELVVARKMEARFSKPDIFAAYVNRAYFGAGALGIGAAARVYFGVTPRELTLTQSALLVAMVPAPGRYNPFVHPEAALERRQRVLDRLRSTGYATRAEVEFARAQPLGIRGRPEVRVDAPEVERAAWAELAELDARTDWRHGGLTIDTDIDLVRQRIAQRAIRDHLYAFDQRQGQREQLGRVDVADPESRAKFEAAWTAAVFAGDTVPALVTRVTGAQVAVWAGGERTLDEPAWGWAVPYQLDARNHAQRITDPTEAFAPGDVVLLHATLGIVQFPRVEAAYASADIASAQLEAMVGGFDPERSEFNRAIQGCRQPGSTFKPIVYSAALDAGYTPATMLRDAPMRISLGPFEEWRPRNADGSFEGHVTLWQALIWSRNLTTLSVYRDIGAARTIRRARELGITSDLDAVESLALGASCLHLTELITVYSTFARSGFGETPRLVARVDAPGHRPVVDNGGALRTSLSAQERTRRLWLDRSDLRPPRLPRANAFQVGWLLSQVVQAGTASDLRDVGFDIAGKTGTTNAYDAWFAGFTARDISVAWIGSDLNTRSLGRRESGGHLALPAWRDAQLPPQTTTPLLPEAPHRIDWVAIEPQTGNLAAEDRWSVLMPFQLHTAPRQQADTQERLDRIEIERLEREF